MLLLLLFVAAIFIAAEAKLALAFLFALAIGLVIGYVFRAAIAKDLSSVQVSVLVHELETAARADIAGKPEEVVAALHADLKSAATTAANTLRKVL